MRTWPLATLISIAALAGCTTVPNGLPPVALASNVDLPRFMGDWYVIASIPKSRERGAYNAAQHYELASDGSIPTVFSFNAGAFDGPRTTYESTGYVVPGTGNAVWSQHYLWLIRADDRISYLAPDYSETVITRDQRDYVWILARTPSITEARLNKLITFVGSQGYNISLLQRVPQASGK